MKMSSTAVNGEDLNLDLHRYDVDEYRLKNCREWKTYSEMWPTSWHPILIGSNYVPENFAILPQNCSGNVKGHCLCHKHKGWWKAIMLTGPPVYIAPWVVDKKKLKVD